MKAYSQDFRLKIVETQKKTQETIQQLADRFGVSYSFVKRLLKRYQTQGSVEPKPHGGGATPKLTSEQIILVAKLVEEDNDATLKQLCGRLEEKTGTLGARANSMPSAPETRVDPKKKVSSR